jgi:phosphoribosylformylglycinamidine cyclo-ligase
VDIDNKMKALSEIKKMVRKASRVKGVLSDLGLFGGLFQSPGSETALVSSADGVGTKLKVAVMARRHDTVGQDLVNHCVNDILVQGATPLFFLDYIGTSKFDAAMFKQVISGLCIACKENGCALIGGETAEMPGLYPPGEYDLVGTIVGQVEKKRIIDGRKIRPGDFIIGLPSTGLQTNGFSLARKVIFDTCKLKINSRLPGENRTVADVLLAVHKSYLKPVVALMKAVDIHGMAHITGGGFYDNIPRVLPPRMLAVVNSRSWTVPPVYRFIQEHGKVDTAEMYRVFNMGIGYVIIVSPIDADEALSILKSKGEKARIIGRIEKGRAKGTIVTG